MAMAAAALIKIEALNVVASPIVGIMMPDEIKVLHWCSKAFMTSERRILLLLVIVPRLGWV